MTSFFAQPQRQDTKEHGNGAGGPTNMSSLLNIKNMPQTSLLFLNPNNGKSPDRKVMNSQKSGFKFMLSRDKGDEEGPGLKLRSFSKTNLEALFDQHKLGTPRLKELALDSPKGSMEPSPIVKPAKRPSQHDKNA